MTHSDGNTREVSVDEISIETSDLAPAEPLADPAVTHEERFVEAFDDEKLFFQTWQPADAPPENGVVAVLHGYGEHSSRYAHVAAALGRAGYATAAIDVRGHGRSTGRRAHVDSFEDYLRDADTLLDEAAARWPDRPIFVLGHSNGGLIALHHALRRSRPVDGYIVSSPFLGFAIDVPRTKNAAGRLLSRLWPTFSLPTGLDPESLSHDPRVVERYREDPLVLSVSTGRWFTETLDAQKQLLARADEIDVPCLFLVAGADDLADPSTTDEVFHRLASSDREMDVFPNLKHEILNEPNWASIVERIARWMRRHRPGEPTEDAA